MECRDSFVGLRRAVDGVVVTDGNVKIDFTASVDFGSIAGIESVQRRNAELALTCELRQVASDRSKFWRNAWTKFYPDNARPNTGICVSAVRREVARFDFGDPRDRETLNRPHRPW